MRKLWLALVISGIIIATIPVSGGIYTSYRQNLLIREWGKVNLELENADAFNESEPENPQMPINSTLPEIEPAMDENNSNKTTDSMDTAPAETKQPSAINPVKKPPATEAQYTVLGILRIDKIKVNVPIMEGADPEKLKVGVGLISGTSGIGDIGNTAIAGHRSYTFGKFFNRLDELNTGDEIEITTSNKKLKYSIYEKLIVKPDDMSVLKKSTDEIILTLITCHPIYVANHRLVLHAKLVN